MQALPRHSLVTGAADSLRTAIESGEFSDLLPNVRSLSRDLCVSIPTVLAAVKVLEDEGYVRVSHGCPTRILRSAKDRENRVATPWKKIIFLGFDPDSVEKTVYYRGVTEALIRAGYEVEFLQYTKKVWSFSEREFDRLIAGKRAGCWVLVSGPVEVQELFAARGLPCLIEGRVARKGLPIPDFEMDYTTIYQHAARQFMDLGHRRIHLLIGEHSARKNPDSIDAFVAAVRDRFPDQTKKSLVKLHDGGVTHFRAILEALFSEKEKPTALCVAQVSRLIMTQTWLLSNGYCIPHDVSLICRDSDENLESLTPLPAHYAHCKKRAMSRFLRAVIAIAEGRRVKNHTLIVPNFIEGKTLGLSRDASNEGVDNFRGR